MYIYIYIYMYIYIHIAQGVREVLERAQRGAKGMATERLGCRCSTLLALLITIMIVIIIIII